MQANLPPRTAIPHGNSFNPPPSKRKRPNARSKATRACDKCRKAKTRCSGDKPCTCCIGLQMEHECTYEAPYSRGTAPKIKVNPVRDQDSNFHSDLGSIDPYFNQHRQPIPGGPNRELSSDTRTMPPPYQQQYNHGSNNFFQGVQQGTVHVSAFGDLPMPIDRSRMCPLPNKSTSMKLLATYFDYVSQNMLFLHIPTVENWAIELSSDDGYTLERNELKSRNAVLLLVFAAAQAYLSGSEATNSDASSKYFTLADDLLQSEAGPPQLATVQARLLQCSYLLARGRINQCWSTFTTVVGLLYTLGLHRKDSQSRIINLIEIECQKRVFWAAFALDKYLSYALDDRPQLIHLDSIDQEIPRFVNDRQLTSTFLMPPPEDALSMNFASILHVELSIIISKILKNVYGIRKPDVKKHLQLATAYLLIDLTKWKMKASLLLDANLETMSNINKRQRTELLLAYHHTRILLLRNFLLNQEIPPAFNSNTITPGDNPIDIDRENAEAKSILEEEIDEKNGMVVEACMGIYQIIMTDIEYIEHVQSLTFRSGWFAQYVTYSAAVMTYVASYQHPDMCDLPLKWARGLHQALKFVAHPGTFMGQCVGVLDELVVAVDESIEAEMNAQRIKTAERATKKGAKRGAEKGADQDTATDQPDSATDQPADEQTQNADQDEDRFSEASGSEYEDIEEAVSISSGDDDGEDMNMNVAEVEDENMEPERNDREEVSDGRVPIMERIKDWGFSRLTSPYM